MTRKKSKNTTKTRRRLKEDEQRLGRAATHPSEIATARLGKLPVESGTAGTERSAGRSDQTAVEQGNAAEEHNQIKFHRPTEPDSGIITEK